ncbi:MAG: hypothetical protein M4579_002259 [Chaenotheca gracillima]|nr:MAG: hypothetical protein M4579_002259 [Chaenotheca gracillima]
MSITVSRALCRAVYRRPQPIISTPSRFACIHQAGARNRDVSVRRARGGARRPYSTESISAAELQFGQPLHETHPHLLQAGELTPSITAQEYHKRRTELARSLPSDDAIAILCAAPTKFKRGAAFYEYCQDPDFFWVTGKTDLEAHDGCVRVERTGPGGDHLFHLYVRPKDPQAELWDGARSGVIAARDVFNADEADSVHEMHKSLPSIIAEASEIYIDKATAGTPAGPVSQLDRLMSPRSTTRDAPITLLENALVRPIRPLMDHLRMFKSEAEIALMRRAGQASGRAFTNAMRRQFMGEKELAAYLDYQFKMEGCDGSAYVPVVAGGEHALSIHYVRNDDVFSGIYVPDDERWPKHFRGMGIRIEDSVCIQETSPLVLTTEAVKEVVDIEAVADTYQKE